MSTSYKDEVDHHLKQMEAELRREDAMVRRARRTLRRLLVDVGPYLWHWGDGTGGWLVEQLSEIADSLHFPVPRFSLELPPVGPHRREIYERDAYRCQECGDWHDLTIDHIVPRSQGGSDDPNNLRVLCRSCNSKKGAQMPEVADA